MGEFRAGDETPDKSMVSSSGVIGEGGRVIIDSELMADIGHQLRNQLNAVLGAAGLLSSGAESGEERELASIVEIGAEQVARLIDDVLDAAIMQSDELELALHPFDLRSCVEMCLALVADDAGVKSLDLSFGAQPDVPGIVVGDSRRLEQILLTLLHGAVDRTFRGGVGVELSSEDRGGLVALHFTIRDTGRGVPARILRGGLDGAPAAHEHMEPGDRLAVLSLSTTKQLVEMMDGDLRVEQGGVEAGPDAGTAFDFTILAEALPPTDPATQLTLNGMRVLVVSADATDKRVLALQAEQWGADATAVSPEEALGIVKEGRPFDIALVEHRQPVIDGLALSTEIRALRRPDQLPIVLISLASPGPQEAEAADNGVIQATLTKPVVPRTLHDVMIQVGAHGVPSPPVAIDAVPGGLSVLIADDNALNQNLLRRLVTKLGHSANVVSNGREAVAAVAQQPYDAVLMDVLMPEMDGLAAAEAICRRWPRGNRPRLIALTALAGPGDQERCIKAGFDDYMSKPVHLADLVEALRAAAGYRTNRERPAL
ncbi:MAG TPA: response regulator [Candidatus Baltobacterales bacterium]|nr:response regulator [Candidatus Baltobacterales bacterium]